MAKDEISIALAEARGKKTPDSSNIVTGGLVVAPLGATHLIVARRAEHGGMWTYEVERGFVLFKRVRRNFADSLN